MRADRQTDRHADRNTSPIYWRRNSNMTCTYKVRQLYNKKQNAVKDGRLCRCASVPLQANWTKRNVVFDSDPLAPLCKNMTLSTNQDVHDISHCHHRATATGNM